MQHVSTVASTLIEGVFCFLRVIILFSIHSSFFLSAADNACSGAFPNPFRVTDLLLSCFCFLYALIAPGFAETVFLVRS